MSPIESLRSNFVKRAARPLVLGADCTLAESAALKSRLLEVGTGGRVAMGFPLVIDGRAVARIDTAGLQLLVAFAQRQGLSGRRLVWSGVSAELLRASRQLGLVEALGLTTVAELR
jgi:anti-anti-sigma regulatory factor